MKKLKKILFYTLFVLIFPPLIIICFIFAVIIDILQLYIKFLNKCGIKSLTTILKESKMTLIERIEYENKKK